MCGICGEWNRRGAEQATLERMNRRLTHRGPDDHGEITLGEAGLAMSRLSIIDLEGGHQPIPNEDESAWIVFNGEIYNHLELRRGLLSRGHRFRTETDTESILHLYEERGERVVDELRGMFAFAIWDRRRRRLLLARDRFGQKPLFYCLERGRLLFASELKSILAVREAAPEVDEESLDDYLSMRFIPSPRTMLAGIRKLPPGHLLLLDAPGDPETEPRAEVRRYWRLDFRPKRRISERDAVEEVRERVLEAVESHLIADVEVGSYLSGGMDSSLIVAAMARSRGEGFPTFAIGVREDDFNELPYAREVAERYRTEHHEEVVWPDLVKLVPKIIHHLDEPSDPIAACMYHSAALAARRVKVVLTGDGGDEIFAGFDRYLGFRWVRYYAALPAPVRRALLGPVLGRLPDSGGYKNLTQKLRWLHELSFFRGGRRYAEATVFFRFGGEGREGLYGPEMAAKVAGRDPAECIATAFDEAEADDDLDRMLYADVVTRLPEHSLMLADRMTMAHSLEGRCPFLDHRLAELVAVMPAAMKAQGKRPKHLMREVSRELLPRSIVERPKQGFMFPLAYWMKGPLLPVLRGLVESSAVVEAGLFRSSTIDRLVREHVASRADHHVRLWMILNMEVWYRMYILGESVGDLSGALEERVSAPAG